MTWQEALPVAIARTGHRRLEWLCSEANPDERSREHQRQFALQIAGQPQYPRLSAQVASLAGDLWDWAVSGFTIRPQGDQMRLRAICGACPEWVEATRRCRLCGCKTDLAIKLRTKHCPLDPPRW